MRPRHKTAENLRVGGDAAAVIDFASMRPRHKTAENFGGSWNKLRISHVASMRPRHKTAENQMMTAGECFYWRSFNEAAA